MTFEEFIKAQPIPGVDPVQQDAALKAVGTDGGMRQVEGDSFDGVMKQVSAFVRNLRGLGVEESARVERHLMQRAGIKAAMIGKEFVLGSAVGVIAARGYLRAVLVYLGFDWARSMLVQSSCSELCRFASTFKNSVLRVSVDDGRAAISLTAPGLNRANLEGARPLLTGLFEQVHGYHVKTTKDGQEFVFVFELQQTRGNAA
jgi:hypothetical protein